MSDRTRDEIEESRDKLKTFESPMYFFDINKDGAIAPRTRNAEGKYDLAILKNEQAVIESLYNILLTQPGERVMRPEFGCDLNQYIFEPIDDVTAYRIIDTVMDSIEKHEPRVFNLRTIITPDPDNNTFIIDIYFRINTSREIVQLSTSLQKIR